MDSAAKQFISGIMGLREPNGISGLQCRMARAGLRWSLSEAAAQANIGAASVGRIEAEAVQSTPSTIAALRRAFEAAGVEFIEDYGVHIRKPQKS